MFTGQISSQARQVTQANTSSGRTRSKRWPSPSSMASVDTGPETPTTEAATSPVLSTISLGSRGLPVMLAGHTEVHRPQMVQASVSKICFQVRSVATMLHDQPRSVAMLVAS